jgi:hypothetical protein
VGVLRASRACRRTRKTKTKLNGRCGGLRSGSERRRAPRPSAPPGPLLSLHFAWNPHRHLVMSPACQSETSVSPTIRWSVGDDHHSGADHERCGADQVRDSARRRLRTDAGARRRTPTTCAGRPRPWSRSATRTSARTLPSRRARLRKPDLHTNRQR